MMTMTVSYSLIYKMWWRLQIVTPENWGKCHRNFGENSMFFFSCIILITFPEFLDTGKPKFTNSTSLSLNISGASLFVNFLRLFFVETASRNSLTLFLFNKLCYFFGTKTKILQMEWSLEWGCRAQKTKNKAISIE